MTHEELIARLREIQGQAGLFASEAADRIEALVKARREDALELLAAHGQAQDAYEAQLKAEARAERLEAALRLLHDNVVLAFPALANLGPVANARAALSATTEEGHE